MGQCKAYKTVGRLTSHGIVSSVGARDADFQAGRDGDAKPFIFCGDYVLADSTMYNHSWSYGVVIENPRSGVCFIAH